MAVIYYYDAASGTWKPITGGSGGGTPGPQGPKGDKGDPGESVKVTVQATQPAGAKAGDVWISNS